MCSHTPFSMRSLLVVATIPLQLVAVIVSGPVAMAQAPQGKVVTSTFVSQALEGNPVGYSATRRPRVYLPPSYETSDRRYPVLYYLHGAGGGPSNFFNFGGHNVANRLIGSGLMDEMIIVGVDGTGGQVPGWAGFVNSELNGNYEDYVTHDLVSHIDTEFRTIPKRDSRGLFGQSMGGAATSIYAMTHTDVFGAAYSLASGFHSFSRPDSFPNLSGDKVVFTGGPNALSELRQIEVPSDFRVNYGGLIFVWAGGFSPNLDNPPLRVDYPFDLDSLEVIPEVRDKWYAYDAFLLLNEHADDLSSLRGYGFGVGDSDDNLQANKAFHQTLLDVDIEHDFDVFPGGHADNMPVRYETALTFLSNAISGVAIGGWNLIGRDDHWDDLNVAALGTATQSSDYRSNSLASNAIDFDSKTMARTSSEETHHWWQVDLGQPTEINEIRIENGASRGRNLTDGGGFRAEVLLPDQSVAWSQDYVGTQTAGILTIGVSDQESVNGQIVRLSKLDPVAEGASGAFRLREVEVIADMQQFDMARYKWHFDIDAENNIADVLEIGNQLQANNTEVVVTLLQGDLEAGDSFDILDYQSVSGMFAHVELPDLPGTLQWHTAALYKDGSISVTHRGDFDGSGQLGPPDMDLMTAALGGPDAPRVFDLTSDGSVDDADRDFWVERLAHTRFGDANLDQHVDFADFLLLSASFSQLGGWGNGDFDGNGFVQFPDFLLLSSNFGAATAAIPEPSGFGLCTLATISLLIHRRRRGHRRRALPLVVGA